MPAELATIAERYALEEKIAQGGMATVWKARDEVLARTVAVKMLHPHLSRDAEFLERFRREALAAARLSHPNIVAIYDTGDETDRDGEGRHYIVMEHCGGGTVADLLATGPLEPARVASIGAAIADALGYAHRHGIVHRDVKPANVLVASDGAIKVTDFGIAKAAFTSGDVTTTGALLGTVLYISPEQARGEDPDARSDLYSLGALLYELVTGRPPFIAEGAVATAMKHVSETPPTPRSLRAGIPKRLEALILRALEKDPDARFSSADEMGAALSGLGGDATVVLEAPRRAPAEIAPRPRPRFPVIPVLAALALLLILVIVGVALVDGEGDAPAGPSEPPRGASGGSLEIHEVSDFDPRGDGVEHADETSLAHDGNASTSWTTETYESSLSSQGKPGVGLLIDLGDERDVASIRIQSASPGYSLEVRAAAELPEDEASAEVVAEIDDAGADEQVDFDPVAARYWIVWITELPGETAGSASIAEVEFSGA